MTRPEAIKRACEIVALAYLSIDDYSRPSDGFCDECNMGPQWNYQNAGHALDYVEAAVREKLQRDGYAIKEGRDNATEMAR